MSQYFSKPKSLRTNAKVELGVWKYAAKANLKNATDANTSDSDVDKSDVDKLDIHKLKNVPSTLINLKNEVGKLDVDKLVHVPVVLSKLSDVVKYLILQTCQLILLLMLK